MGANNVSKVFTHWGHLKHREARALAYMANRTMDGEKPPVYFGGWKEVAKALGLDTEAKKASAKETYRQALAALRAEGAVISSGLVVDIRVGVRAEYALALDPTETFVPSVVGQVNGRPKVTWAVAPREEWGNEPLPHAEGPERQEGQGTVAPEGQGPIVPEGARESCEWGNEPLPPRSTSQVLEKEHLKEQASGDVNSPAEDQDEAPLLDEEIPMDDPEAAQTMGNDMPASWDEEIDDYEEASKYLQGLPDVGQSHMQAINASRPDAPLKARVIAAANIAGWNQQESRKAS